MRAVLFLAASKIKYSEKNDENKIKENYLVLLPYASLSDKYAYMDVCMYKYCVNKYDIFNQIFFVKHKKSLALHFSLAFSAGFLK